MKLKYKDMPAAPANDRPHDAEPGPPVTTAEAACSGLLVIVFLILGILPIGLLWPSTGWLFRAFIGLLLAPWPAAWLTRIALRHRKAQISFFDVASAIWLTFFATLLITRMILHFTGPKDPWQAYMAFTLALFTVLLSPASIALATRGRTSDSAVMRRRTTFALAVAALLALALPRVAPGPHTRARVIAGWSARDCGYFKNGWDGERPEEGHSLLTAQRETVRACIESARAAGVGFFYAVDLMGIDSWVADGLIGTPDGRVRRLHFDRFQCDIAGLCATYVALSRCEEPRGIDFDSDSACPETVNERHYGSIW